MRSSFSIMRRTPRSTLFHKTPLFRSVHVYPPMILVGRRRISLEILHRLIAALWRSEEHTSELQSLMHLVCGPLFQLCGEHRDLLSFTKRRSSALFMWILQ